MRRFMDWIKDVFHLHPKPPYIPGEGWPPVHWSKGLPPMPEPPTQETFTMPQVSLVDILEELKNMNDRLESIEHCVIDVEAAVDRMNRNS